MDVQEQYNRQDQERRFMGQGENNHCIRQHTKNEKDDQDMCRRGAQMSKLTLKI